MHHRPSILPLRQRRLWLSLAAALALVIGLLPGGLAPAAYAASSGQPLEGAAAPAARAAAETAPDMASAPLAATLAITKTLMSPVRPGNVLLIGDTATFQIVVENTGGPEDIAYLPLADLYDTVCLDFRPKADPAESSYDDTLGVVNWSNLTVANAQYLAPGQRFTTTVTFDVTGPTGTGLNTARVSGALDENGGAVLPDPATSQVSFTCLEPASIGDRIWDDQDGDGTDNGGAEPGLGAVEVRLTPPPALDLGNGPGVPITTTSTITGYYSFPMLPPATYTVTVDTATTPAGYAQTGDPDEPGAPCTTCDSQTVVSVAAGQNLDTADFGYQQQQPALAIVKTLVSPAPGPAFISDTITFTIRIQNTGPTLIPTWTVTDTYDITCMTMTSANPPPAAPPGPPWLPPVVWTAPPLPPLAPGQAFTITVDFHADAASANCLNLATVTGEDEFGTPVTPADSQAGVVIDDPGIGVAKRVASGADNGDGTFTVAYEILVQNVGSVTLNNVQVVDNLALTFASAISFTVDSVTSADFTVNGNYDGSTDTNLLAGTDSLPALAEGRILVTVTVRPGAFLGPYLNTATGSGTSPAGTPVSDDSQDGLDTDPDTPGLTPPDNPNPGDNSDPTPLQFAVLSGTVWNDLNGDGNQDPGEPGIPGVVITLTPGVTTTTDLNGDYSFVTLPGNYTVTETDPAGFTSTGDVAPPNDNQIPVTLLPGQTLSGQDFFDWGAGSIGDLVWLDSDGSGTQNGGEQGIYNVGLTLTWFGPDGLLGGGDDYTYPPQTTDLNGNYSFSNLPPGNFQVDVDQTSPTLAGLTLVFGSDPQPVSLTPGQNRTDVDFGYQGSTAVQVVSFGAAGNGSAVQLTWQALLNGEAAPAFHVLRSRLGQPGMQQLTSSPLGPQSGNGQVAAYAYTDSTARGGRTYLYFLRDADGQIFGPWQVRAPAGRLFMPLVSTR